MRLYVLSGVIICALFFTAGARGTVLFAMNHYGRPGPSGSSAHGIAHK